MEFEEPQDAMESASIVTLPPEKTHAELTDEALAQFQIPLSLQERITALEKLVGLKPYRV